MSEPKSERVTPSSSSSAENSAEAPASSETPKPSASESSANEEASDTKSAKAESIRPPRPDAASKGRGRSNKKRSRKGSAKAERSMPPRPATKQPDAKQSEPKQSGDLDLAEDELGDALEEVESDPPPAGSRVKSVPPPPPARGSSPKSAAPRPASRPPKASAASLGVGRLSRVPRPGALPNVSPASAMAAASNPPSVHAPTVAEATAATPLSASKRPPPPPMKTRSVAPAPLEAPAPVVAPAPPSVRPRLGSLPPAPPSRRSPTRGPVPPSASGSGPLVSAPLGSFPSPPSPGAAGVTPLPLAATPLSPGVAPRPPRPATTTPLPVDSSDAAEPLDDDLVEEDNSVVEEPSLIDDYSLLDASSPNVQVDAARSQPLTDSQQLTQHWHQQAVAPAVEQEELSGLDETPGQREAMKNNAQQLAEILQGQLAKNAERGREGRLHYELARLFEGPLQDLEEAARHYEHAARLQPKHAPSLRGARRVLTALGRYKLALKLFDAEIEASPHADHKATLYYEKGRMFAERLGHKADARDAFAHAAELAPTRLDILKALANAEEQAGAWRKMVSALESAANAAASFPAERAAYLCQMARTSATALADPDRAIELYKAALAVDPRAPSALPALGALLYQKGRWKELIEALELEASLATTRQAQAFAKYRAGQLWVQRMGDMARGVATLEQASALAPSDVTILEELVRLYDLTDAPKNLSSALERLAAQQQPPSVDVLHRLGQLYEERLDQPDLAVRQYTLALETDPAYRPATVALARLWEARGEWRQLAQMLSQEADVSEDVEHRAALHARIAELCEVRLGSVDYAIEHHKKALELSPDHAPAFKALVRLYSQLSRWHELIELCRRGIEVAHHDDERVSLLFAIGRLEEEALGQPQAAARTYERILDIDKSSMEAIHALQRAAERGGEFETLVRALELEVTHTREKSVQLALRHRAAMVRAEQLRDRAGAIELLRAILSDDADHKASIVSLSELLHAEGRWDELLTAHAAELRVIAAKPAKAALLFKMGEICERRLGKLDQAITQYRQAVLLDKTHHGATVALRRLLTKTEEFEEVCKLLEAEATHEADAKRAARVWLLLGETCENHLGAVERALVAYRRAIELDPALRPATDACLRLLEQSGQHKRLAAQLEVEQEEGIEPMYAAAAAFRAAEVQRDMLSEPDVAAAVFEKMLQRDPNHVGALLALERIYAARGDDAALASVYERQAVAFDDVGAQIAAYRGLLATLERAETVDWERVRATQFALLHVAPDDVQALRALEAVSLSGADVTLTSQVDAKLAMADLDGSSSAAHKTRLGEAFEASGDHGRALDLYRSALLLEPRDMAAARGISRIAEQGLVPELLVEAAEHEAACLGRVDEGARLLVLAANVSTEAGDQRGAATHLSRALHLDPDHARAADALVSLHGRGLGPDFVIDVLSRAAEAAQSKERRAALWVQVARLESRAKRDAGAATAAVKRALKERPNDVDAHLLLAHFYAGSKKWDECVSQLQALLKLNPNDELRFDALLRLATIQHERLKATALAASNVSSALGMKPENREALELMLRVQLDREELGAAATTAEKLVKTAKSDPERARALYHSARLHRQQGDMQKASTAFAEAVALTGTDDAVAREYREWLEARRAKADWRPYADALQSYLQRSELTDDQVMKARRALGFVLYDNLDQADEGLKQLRAASKLAPNDAELRRAIAERLERAGHFEAGAKAYHELLRGAPHAVSFWRSLAACYTGMGATASARAALAPLIAVGEASEDERTMYGAHQPRPSSARAGALSGAALRSVEEETSVAGPAVDLLESLSPALPKLYPINFEAYGVSARDKVVSRSAHKLRALSEDVAAVFGVSEFDVYVHRTGPPGVSVECGEHPSVFIHAEFDAQPETVKVFTLARIMSNVARGISLVDKLSAQEVELLLVCATRNYQANFGSDLSDPSVLDAQSRRISKAMPWFKGNRLEPSARAFAAASVDSQAWVQQVHITAIRAGALVCDDPAEALRTVAVTGVADSVLERVASFVASKTGQDLQRRLFGR